MSKALKWAGSGLVLGVLATLLFNPPFRLTPTDGVGTTALDAGVANASGPLLREVEDLSIRVDRLETRIDEIAGKLRENQSRIEPGAGAESPQRNTVPTESASPDISSADRSREISEKLLAGGFAPDRVQWIEDRSEALLLAQIEASYEAERAGEPLSIDSLERLSPQYMLRAELGDWEYERYLEALGRPTTVGITTVLQNSPAARAGLVSGDQVVSYDGVRVYNSARITELMREGTVGETVFIDIVRDGQPIQFAVPRGSLGVALALPVPIALAFPPDRQ